ncbi:hypothetical protein REPUB_Repub14bG0056400 [Reevesia pubescens]
MWYIITAATIINVFNGTTNFGTLVGAFLCDTYFGRYKALGFATVASFVGLLAIQLTAAIPELHPHCCAAKGNGECKGPTVGQLAFLLIGLGLMIVGAGGVRPCNLAFGVDQFNPKTESGEREIDSFFNWYFFTFTFAHMISLTLIFYIQSNVSWAIGLGIPAILMLIACVVYFVGSKIYVKVKASGSPMTSVAQVYFTLYEQLKDILSSHDDSGGQLTIGANMLATAGAGSATAFTTNPLWVVKTRLRTYTCNSE